MRPSSEIGKTVRALRGELSLREFAKKCDISHTTLDNIEKGVDFRTGKPTNPSAIVLAKIATAARVPLSYIIGVEDPPIDIEQYGLRTINKRKIPVLGEIACGKPILATEELETYVVAGADINADFCLIAKGDSMIDARIKDGDVVFIKKQSIVNNGEIAAVIIDGEATLKKWFYYPEKQKLVLNPANVNYEPLIYTGVELDSITCIGRAVCFMSNL